MNNIYIKKEARNRGLEERSAKQIWFSNLEREEL